MKQRQPALDLDEIASNKFIVHNPMINGLLKGEGIINGHHFELTTWRREGLIARLRGRGFKVRTLMDQIAALPNPPSVPPALGGLGWRPLASSIERFSRFDPDALRWMPLTPEERQGAPGISARSGSVLRRRKGRGSATYHLAFGERNGGIGLQPLAETEAILVGYAQAVAHDDRPLLAERCNAVLLLPDLELPPPHRALLERIATLTDDGLSVDQNSWPLVQALFARVGFALNAADKEPRIED